MSNERHGKWPPSSFTVKCIDKTQVHGAFKSTVSQLPLQLDIHMASSGYEFLNSPRKTYHYLFIHTQLITEKLYSFAPPGRTTAEVEDDVTLVILQVTIIYELKKRSWCEDDG
ncbi:hypothetical protein STEG23_000017 [Scotinomys teguina]